MMKDAILVARDLQLWLPPINAEALARRFCSNLQLPLEVCVGVDELLDVYALGGLTLKLSSLSLHIPYSKVMAMLVVAAKIYFKPLPPDDGRDGGGSQLSSHGWVPWAFQAVHRSLKQHPPSNQADVPRQLRSTYGCSKVPPETAEAHKRLLAISASHKSCDNEPPMLNPTEAEDLPSVSEGQRNAFLVTAAAALIWVSPTYLRNQITNLEIEILKVERVAMDELQIAQS